MGTTIEHDLEIMSRQMGGALRFRTWDVRMSRLAGTDRPRSRPPTELFGQTSPLFPISSCIAKTGRSFFGGTETAGRRTNIRRADFRFTSERSTAHLLGQWNERSLLLPAASGFGTCILTRSGRIYSAGKISAEQKQGIHCRSKSPAVLVSIVYHPGHSVSSKGNTARIQVRPWSMTIPLQCSKVKARQLKKSDYTGPRGTIICEVAAACYVWPDWSTTAGSSGCGVFRQHRSVDFVAIVAIKQGNSWGRAIRVRPEEFLSKRSRVSRPTSSA